MPRSLLALRDLSRDLSGERSPLRPGAAHIFPGKVRVQLPPQNNINNNNSSVIAIVIAEGDARVANCSNVAPKLKQTRSSCHARMQHAYNLSSKERQQDMSYDFASRFSTARLKCDESVAWIIQCCLGALCTATQGQMREPRLRQLAAYRIWKARAHPQDRTCNLIN